MLPPDPRRWSLVLMMSIAACVLGATPAEEGAPTSVVRQWLVLDPVAHPLPLFHDESSGEYGLSNLLDDDLLPDGMGEPTDGRTLSLWNGDTRRWTRRSAGPLAAPPGDEQKKKKKKKRDKADDGEDATPIVAVTIEAPDDGRPAVAWLATYVRASQWESLTLHLDGHHPRRAWLGGRPIASGGKGGVSDEVSAEVDLTPGRHLLLVQTVFDPDREAGWSVGARLTGAAAEDGQDATPIRARFSVEHRRSMELRDILDAPRVNSTAVSPDGGRVALGVARIVPGTHERDSWIEMRDARSGDPLWTWRGNRGARQIDWSPDGRYLSFVASSPGSEKASTLFLYDVAKGSARPLFDGIERLGSYRWLPDGRAIVYSASVEAKKDERGIKRVRSIRDRWASGRNRSFLHMVSVPDGISRRLTAGEASTGLGDIAPGSDRLLFRRSFETVEARPYSRTELWELDLATFEATKLRDFGWLSAALYAPEGTDLLIASQPDEFGGAGEGIQNSYDTQLFLWDRVGESADLLTRDFDPAVGGVVWHRGDRQIYLSATETDTQRLYRLDPQARTFAAVDIGVEVLADFELARKAPTAVITGTSAWEPQQLHRVDLAAGSTHRLAHPADAWFAEVERGAVRDWEFTASNGKTIDGRYYLPPGFDPQKKYPMILYYYGGTVPVDRGFGGRYPKEWWASSGYVVYVPQPSGATGYGREFSTAHVNDWGKTSSEEILEGLDRFLAAHDFVDPERVGSIGASYGGFMTMLLSTKTDRLAAAVAHAGISSISSYWGEGYWGYSYNSVAGAESFPWNRRDLYVDQSPLFRADQNRVPILLTHGTADTNVPVGESDQFFVALKLLGKDVEYLQVEGQNHWILDHAKREVWSQSIVAWFDRWLKDEPAWWEDLWPSPVGDGPESSD